ncbi:MAG: hypothetical protein AAB696_01040 [Patescibacteria group bacterium]
MFFKEKISNFNNQNKEWIAEHRKDIIIFSLIFLISSLSFGLGYLVNRESNHAPIIIEKCSDTALSY